jgi:hypothetical protein
MDRSEQCERRAYADGNTLSYEVRNDMTPSEHAERAIRKAYHIAENEPIPESLLELRLAIVNELWDFLAENAKPVTPATEAKTA